MNHTLGDSEQNRIVPNIRQNPSAITEHVMVFSWIRRLKTDMMFSRYPSSLWNEEEIDGIVMIIRRIKRHIIVRKMRWDAMLRSIVPSSKDPLTVKDKDNDYNAFIWTDPTIHAHLSPCSVLVVESLLLHRQTRRIRLRLLFLFYKLYFDFLQSQKTPHLPSSSKPSFTLFTLVLTFCWRLLD